MRLPPSVIGARGSITGAAHKSEERAHFLARTVAPPHMCLEVTNFVIESMVNLKTTGMVRLQFMQ